MSIGSFLTMAACFTFPMLTVCVLGLLCCWCLSPVLESERDFLHRLLSVWFFLPPTFLLASQTLNYLVFLASSSILMAWKGLFSVLLNVVSEHSRGMVKGDRGSGYVSDADAAPFIFPPHQK